MIVLGSQLDVCSTHACGAYCVQEAKKRAVSFSWLVARQPIATLKQRAERIEVIVGQLQNVGHRMAAHTLRSCSSNFTLCHSGWYP